MNQKMRNIIIQELLELFLLVYKMMFQNLPTKMFRDKLIAGNAVDIKLKIIAQSLNKS